jgi:hypothetical protein
MIRPMSLSDPTVRVAPSPRFATITGAPGYVAVNLVRYQRALLEVFRDVEVVFHLTAKITRVVPVRSMTAGLSGSRRPRRALVSA